MASLITVGTMISDCPNLEFSDHRRDEAANGLSVEGVRPATDWLVADTKTLCVVAKVRPRPRVPRTVPPKSSFARRWT